MRLCVTPGLGVQPTANTGEGWVRSSVFQTVRCFARPISNPRMLLQKKGPILRRDSGGEAWGSP